MDPDPISQKQWSQWCAKPKQSEFWPGVDGTDHQDGIEVHHGELRAIAKRLARSTEDIQATRDSSIGGKETESDYSKRDAAWRWNEGAWMWKSIKLIESSLRAGYLPSVQLEILIAACLIDTAGKNYDYLDSVDLHVDWFYSDEYVGYGVKGDGHGISRQYYKVADNYNDSSCELPFLGKRDADIGNFDADDIGNILQASDPAILDEYHTSLERTAGDLVDLTSALLQRAQEMSDVWRGPAARAAQKSLRKIYGCVQGLAYDAGQAGQASSAFSEALRWYRANYDRIVVPEKEVLPLETYCCNERAREYLRNFNEQIRSIHETLPKKIYLKLPGLIPARDRYLFAGDTQPRW